MRVFTRFLSFLFIATSMMSVSAIAEDSPIAFEADKVQVNQEDGSMYATGNVVLKQAGKTLRADEVTYNKPNDRAVARGNVIMTLPDGTRHKAVIMEVDTEFTHIIAETLSTKFADGTSMKSKNGEQTVGDKAVFQSARFTPCKCDFENGETPLWDLRTTSTVRSEKTQTISHNNVRMHVLNIPVGYFPYLAHPDWTVRRRSGFLTPSFIISSDLGFTGSIPYYQVIDDTRDIEFTPYKYQYRGTAIKTRYRQKWDNSDLNAAIYTASVETYKKNREAVGAVDALFTSKLGNDWNLKARLNRASQDTFMRRYNFDDSTSLKSEIVAERLKSDRYYLVEANDIQTLKTKSALANEPSLLPNVYYEEVQAGFRKNQTMRTEIQAFQLDNDQGYDLSRWSGTAQITEDFPLTHGIASYDANIIGSYYSLHSKPTAATTKIGDLTSVNPSVSLGYRLPLATSIVDRVVILEPQAKLVHVAGEDNTKEIPNRDAADYRIDEANLFLLNRYQGKDYILPGSRMDVGLSAITQDAVIGEISGFAGVSRRLSSKRATGLSINSSDIYSDYVASASIDPPGAYKITWSGRLSSHDFTLNESKTTVAGNFGVTNWSLDHNQLTKAYFASSSDDREELTASANQSFDNGWNVSASQIWDLSYSKTKQEKTSASLGYGSGTFSVSKTRGGEKNATLIWNGGVQDCITVTVDYKHDPTKDRDIKTVDELNFTISFKHLGALSQSEITNATSNE
jgi:LPS-assembly protein